MKSPFHRLIGRCFPVAAFFVSLFLAQFPVCTESYAQNEGPQDSSSPSENSFPLEENSSLAEEPELDDPFEAWNRGVLELNTGLDTLIFNPVIRTYTLVVPPMLQTGVTKVLENLAAPVSAFNYAFQGDFEKAACSLGRFIINTIFGLGGIFDPATEMDLVVEETDFGETLGHWGASPGFFFVVPVFGPIVVRDAWGLCVDYFLNPLNILLLVKGKENLSWSYSSAVLFEKKRQYMGPLEDLQKTSVDYYVALKSLYRQKRAKHIQKPAPAN